jgi:hypothetical protein
VSFVEIVSPTFTAIGIWGLEINGVDRDLGEREVEETGAA